MRSLPSTFKISLMLVMWTSFIYSTCSAQLHGLGRARHVLAGREANGRPAAFSIRPSTIISAIKVPAVDLSITPIMTDPISPCVDKTCITAAPAPVRYPCESARDDVAQVNAGDDFEVICDIDFPGQNIHPFILAGSFMQCFESCKEYNEDHNDTHCAGFVFAPERIAGADNCYLKSSLNEPGPATIHLVGATLTAAAAMSQPSTTAVAIPGRPESAGDAQAKPRLGTITIKEVKELGSSTNEPTKQYVSHPPSQPINLAKEVTVPGVNLGLLHDYSMASDTGVWTSKDFVWTAVIEDMKTTPHLSRDGGKGGMVNNTNIFLFCDTGVYSDGEFVAFVSSSVATDQSMNALEDKPVTLVDHIGQWQDDVGRMRGFAPMTEGEEAYNKAVSGDGYRYAVWPESSPISLNSTTSLIYASLVYDEVDMHNIEDYNLTYFGNTLLQTKIDPQFGPYADRIVPQMFPQGVIPFGSLAGFRAWGLDGVGGNAGSLLLFGKAPDHSVPGVFVAMTNPQDFMNLSSYSYWNGQSWSSESPDYHALEPSILNISVVDMDVIYMPRAGTFMIIYTVYPPDNTFYYRQLYPRPGTMTGVWPPFQQHGEVDWAETIVTGHWEDQEHVLYKVPNPAVGFMYAGGIHAGYFGDRDISNGGDSILLTWTEHTGKSGDSPESGYAHKVARATISYPSDPK